MHFITAICFLLTVIFAEATPLTTKNRAFYTLLVEAAQKLGGKQLGNCIGTNTTLSLWDTSLALPMPSCGLRLKYVAFGRGTQNYTCASGDESALPVAVGAVATLFDASCIASLSPTIVHELPSALSGVSSETLGVFAWFLDHLIARESDVLVLGQHYFTKTGAPMFDLRVGGHEDWIQSKKEASFSAPSKLESKVQDVPWLKLGFIDGSGIREVYRVHTSGGQPPSTCKGQEESFGVEYGAEYWFYG